MQNGPLYAGAAVVDSAMTTIWMAVTVAVPRLFARKWPSATGAGITGEEEDTETVHPIDLALVIALGALSLLASEVSSTWLEEATGVQIPSMLILTTIALVIAQVPAAQKLRGTRMSGMFAVTLFLAVIGALCDVEALTAMGALGVDLTLFVVVVVVVHGLIVYGGAALARLDPAMASVASQANIGGGTTALALARSLGRADLVLPAILVGSLGTALGTYLGFLTAAWLR